jgi:hypothetical protein
MNKKSILSWTSLVVILAIFAASCKKEQAVAPPNPDNELITTVELVATNTSDATDVQTAKWVKLNPNDTTAPDLSKAFLNLKANAVYNVVVKFLDETKTPVSDITTEILARENYHLICFGVGSALNLTVKRTDHDTNAPTPFEVGLQDAFTTTAASTGNLEVTLHHQPNVKNGDCAPGSVDADVNFNINIK